MHGGGSLLFDGVFCMIQYFLTIDNNTISYDQLLVDLIILRDGAGALKTGCNHDSKHRQYLQQKFNQRMCQLGLYVDDEIWHNCEWKFRKIS